MAVPHGSNARLTVRTVDNETSFRKRDRADDGDGRDVGRVRWMYALAVAVTIGAGLGSRIVALPKEIGDGLYATMVFLAFAGTARRATALHLAIAATAFCFAIELSQLYHAPWIDDIRATTMGHLVLGQAFGWIDLVCYVAGVGVGVAGDRLLTKV